MTLIAAFVISFLAIRGFRYELTGDGFLPVNTESFFWLLLFLFFLTVILFSFREKDRKLILASCLYAVITAVFYIAGSGFEKKECLSWFWETRPNLSMCLNLLFSHAVLYYCFAFLVYRGLRVFSLSAPDKRDKPLSLRKALLLWAALLLVYIPWYLYYFPGVLTDDSNSMIFDALGLRDLSNHHSAFLVLVMRSIMLPIYSLTGSVNSGIAVFSFLQMLVMTFIFALTLERIFYYTSCRVFRILAFFWFTLYPANTNYSVILWKDILFSGSFLAFLLCVDHAAEEEDAFFGSPSSKFRLFFTALLLPLLRHNGLSILLVMTAAFFIRFRKHRRQILLLFGCVWIIYGVWTYAVLPALHVKEVESSLALSVPQQQIARTLAAHHDELPEEELRSLEAYFSVPEIWNEYHALLSDYVKMHFRNEVYKQDPLRFFELWAKLGLRYPVDYIEAFLHNNYGYWFPEANFLVAYQGMMVTERIGDEAPAPLLKSVILKKVYHWYAYQEYLKTPLLPLLFSRGAVFWLWLFCAGYCLYNRREKFIVFLPGFALWLGILLSPFYNEYRYVYGLFIGLPLLMASVFCGKRNDSEDRDPDNSPAAYTW